MAEPEFTPEELQSEEWRDVAGWEDYYSVSNLGRVHSKRTKKILKPAYGKGYDTYPRVLLCKRPLMQTVRVHLLVTRAFLGPCPDGYEVDHGLSGKTDSRLTNLEYVTASENRKRDFIRGTSSHKGIRNPQAVLTNDAVREIRQRRANGEKLAIIGADFHISDTHVVEIAQRESWKHVD